MTISYFKAKSIGLPEEGVFTLQRIGLMIVLWHGFSTLHVELLGTAVAGLRRAKMRCRQ